MIKLVTIIGARPQFIKAAAISRAIKISFTNRIEEIIVHTGQHYDNNMSQVFFAELQIPEPKYNLHVGSLSHGKQVATMISGIEDVLMNERPDAVLVYGDTNSTLAASIAASKINIPIIHIEAGLRSFNKSMPEELNRIMTDHASSMLFCPTKTAVKNLKNEGLKIEESYSGKANINHPHIYTCGDIMYDNTLYYSEYAEKESKLFETYEIDKNNYILATIHRPNNTDDALRLTNIFESLLEIARKHHTKIVIPLHPRTASIIEKNLPKNIYNEVKNSNGLCLLEPLSFLQMLLFEKFARLIITDSGGVQKEAYFLKKAAIILRAETEWVEIIEQGAAKLVDANKSNIIQAAEYFLGNPKINYLNLFGDGNSAKFICEKIIASF